MNVATGNSHTLRLKKMHPRILLVSAMACAISSCDTPLFPDDVRPTVQREFVGHSVAEMIAAYGNPTLRQMQEGHAVYYWETLTSSVYRPQYTATTQGTIGDVAYSGTTTMEGDPQANVTPCVLVAGIALGSDIVERIDVRGMDCGAFLKR